MTTTYRNPWHEPKDSRYGPAVYSTTARGVPYRGYLIFERIEGRVWDVVKELAPGALACVTQRAGPRGAREAIDALLDAPPVR